MSDRTTDRRQASRCARAEDHGVLAVRIRPGHRAVIVDISSGGVLVETGHRLLPGAAVELLMESPTHKTVVRGRVLRCAVTSVRPSAISYRGAIGFDRALGRHADTAFDEPVSMGGKRPGIVFRADATPRVV